MASVLKDSLLQKLLLVNKNGIFEKRLNLWLSAALKAFLTKVSEGKVNWSDAKVLLDGMLQYAAFTKVCLHCIFKELRLIICRAYCHVCWISCMTSFRYGMGMDA